MNNTQTEFKIGDIIEGEVYKITKFGAFVKLPMGKKGLIHISQISDDFVENISEHLKIGDQAKVRIIAIDGNKIDLTLKLRDYVSSYPKDKDFRGSDLEDKLDFLYTKTKKTMRGGAVR